MDESLKLKLEENNLEENNLEEWTRYVEQLEHFFRVNGIDQDDQKMYSFLALIGPFLYMKLMSILSPNNPEQMGYEALVDKLILHSIMPPSQVMQRFLFWTRKRSPDESLEAYLLQLKLLGSFCNFKESLEFMLLDKLICGLGNQQIQLKLLQSDELTFEKAMKIAQEMEPTFEYHENGDNEIDCRDIGKQNDRTVMTVSEDADIGTNDSSSPMSCPISPNLPPKIRPLSSEKMVSSLKENELVLSHCVPTEPTSNEQNLPPILPRDNPASTNDRKVSSSGIQTAVNVAYLGMNILKETTSSASTASEIIEADNPSITQRQNSLDEKDHSSAQDNAENITNSHHSEGPPQIEVDALSQISKQSSVAPSSDSSLNPSPSRLTESFIEDFIEDDTPMPESQIEPQQVLQHLYEMTDEDTTSKELLHYAIVTKESNSISQQNTPEHNRPTQTNSVRIQSIVNTNNLIKRGGHKITSLLQKLNKDEKRKTYNSPEIPSVVASTETEMDIDILTDKYTFPGPLGYGIRILKKPTGQRDKPAHWKVPSIRGMVEAIARHSHVRTNQLYFHVTLSE